MIVGLGAVILAVALLGTMAALVSALTMTVSSNPSFCASCHEIRPVHDQWVSSTHKGVNCLNCHTERGWEGYVKVNVQGARNIITHLSGQDRLPPEADIKNSSCNYCHPADQLPETRPESTLKVAHSKHEEQSCTTCHNRMVHPGQFEVPEEIKLVSHQPKDCQVCHQNPSPQYLHGNSNLPCTSCHSANIPNHEVAIKRGAMPKENCQECHSRERVSAPETCHTCHVSPHGTENELNCNRCHSADSKGWSQVSFAHPVKLSIEHSQIQCTKCHASKSLSVSTTQPGGAFQCLTCHKPPHQSYANGNCIQCHTITGWKPLTIDHAAVWKDYVGKHATPTCASCHTDGVRFQGTPTDCKSCHQPPSQPHFGAECAQCHQPGGKFKM